jgi:hypothetical protein
MTRKLLFASFAACFFLGLCNNAVAVTKNIDVVVAHGVPTTTCSNLQSNTSYILTADILDFGCQLPSNSPNITLNCNGHTIGNSHNGIAVAIQGTTQTVTNCVIITTSTGVSISGTGNTLNASTVTATGTTGINVVGNNHKITNNIITGNSVTTDDNIVINTVDNILIDGNTIKNNFDLCVEGFVTVTNSTISNNMCYVSSSGFAGIGGYYNNNVFPLVIGSLVWRNNKVINNRFNGAPWYYLATTTGTYRASVDADAQTALDNGNTFSGNASF